MIRSISTNRSWPPPWPSSSCHPGTWHCISEIVPTEGSLADGGRLGAGGPKALLAQSKFKPAWARMASWYNLSGGPRPNSRVCAPCLRMTSPRLIKERVILSRCGINSVAAHILACAIDGGAWRGRCVCQNGVCCCVARVACVARSQKGTAKTAGALSCIAHSAQVAKIGTQPCR